MCDFKVCDLVDYTLLLKIYLINSFGFPEAPTTVALSKEEGLQQLKKKNPKCSKERFLS